MTKELGTLSIGDKVKLGSIYDEPITWIVIDKNHEGYPEDSVTLLSEKIITLKAFDAKEPSSTDTNRQENGNNDYHLSNIRQWLNSDANAGEWYSPQHPYDAPPSEENIYGGNNPYESDAGFLNSWSAYERSILLSTSLDHKIWSGVIGTSDTNTCIDKVFLLSSVETGLGSSNKPDGTKFDYFENATSRLAYPSKKALENNSYTSTSLAETKAWNWFLRSGYQMNSYQSYSINSTGTANYRNGIYGFDGCRPACNLSTNIRISDETDESGAYTIIVPKRTIVDLGLVVGQSGSCNCPDLEDTTVSFDDEGNLIVDSGDNHYNLGQVENHPSGLPDGGTTGQILIKASSENGDANWQEIPKAEIDESIIDEKLSSIKEQLDKVETTANSAKTTADSAASTASSAKTTAESAKTTAESASSTANSASSSVSGKAATNHRSTLTTYGVADDTYYGHVKLLTTKSGLEVRTPSTTETNATYQANVVESLMDSKINALSYPPKSHTSTSSSTYGGGTSSYYGHVKLTDTSTDSSGASSSIAATPTCVNAKVDVLRGDLRTTTRPVNNTTVKLSGTMGGTVYVNVFYREKLGMAALYLTSSGLSCSGTGTQTITTLSSGYRPTAEQLMTLADKMAVRVTTSGAVIVESFGTNTGTGAVGVDFMYFTI